MVSELIGYLLALLMAGLWAIERRDLRRQIRKTADLEKRAERWEQVAESSLATMRRMRDRWALKL